jgi:hypothetical protein
MGRCEGAATEHGWRRSARRCDPSSLRLYADISNQGDGNVLGDTHACGNLHRARNQRLLAGRVLISIDSVLKFKARRLQVGGLSAFTARWSAPFERLSVRGWAATRPQDAFLKPDPTASRAGSGSPPGQECHRRAPRKSPAEGRGLSSGNTQLSSYNPL